MKVKKLIFSAIYVTTLAIGISASASTPKDLAKVNEHSITTRDLELALGSLNEGQRQNVLKDANSRRELLSSLIDRELLAQEGEKLKLDQSPTYKEAINLFRKQWLMTQVVEKKIASQLTEGAVRKFYTSHRDIFSTDQVRVQHILVSDENDAKKILALAKDPKNDFQELAEKYSKDPSAKNNRGDIGFIGHDRMVAPFTEAAFSAAQGEVVGPVHTLYGYHVIKVVQKKVGKPLEFDEVEVQARELLRQQLVKTYAENLKQQSKVQIDAKALEKL